MIESCTKERDDAINDKEFAEYTSRKLHKDVRDLQSKYDDQNNFIVSSRSLADDCYYRNTDKSFRAAILTSLSCLMLITCNSLMILSNKEPLAARKPSGHYEKASSDT